jgi:hypothetical protein
MKSKPVQFEVVYSDATPYGPRETVKNLAWEIIHEAKGKGLPKVEASALKLVMFMHFEKSREGYDWPSRDDRHPNFKEYGRAYLAGSHMESYVSAEAIAILRKEFPPKAHPYLPDGYSEWSQRHVTDGLYCGRACGIRCGGH